MQIPQLVESQTEVWVYFVVVVQLLKSCPTLCDLVDYSTPDFPVLRYLLEFAQTHVH